MAATYLLPVTTALYLFPLVAFLIMLPAAFLSYRRRGRAGGWATVVLYTFVFYLLAIAMQTVIPLPANADYCTGHTYASTPQLRPFYFLEVIEQRARGRWSPGAMLDNPAIWVTVLNIVMLSPLGMFLRYANKMRLVPTLLAGFGLSLLFELTQLTGLWFVYPCPYRLFSVDDLILNTTGVLVGWLITGPLIKVLPAPAPDGDRKRFAAKVTLSRRLLAFVTDLVGFGILLGFLFGLLTLFGQDTDHQGVAILILAFVWFVLVPTMTGSTLGKRAMLLRVEKTSGRRAGPIALLIRNGVLLSPLWLTWLLLDLDRWDIPRHPVQLLLPVGLLLSGFIMLVWTPLAVLFDDERRAPYERFSRTINVAILPPGLEASTKDKTEPVPTQPTGSQSVDRWR